MIVVADTSPLLALLAVRQAEILPRLFQRVVVPEGVRAELARSHPDLPGWVQVETVKKPAEARRLAAMVDWGEAEAIELAKELRADRLLMDERKGRKLAMAEGLEVIGVVGVLILARQKNLIPSLAKIFEALRGEAGFYLSDFLVAEALRACGEDAEKEGGRR